MLTVARVRELLDFNPKTGIFTWKVRRGGKALAGTRAGSLSPDGYIRIRIDWKDYKAHRLGWFVTYGTWPPGALDHEKRKRDDNMVAGLRIATRSQNAANSGLRPQNKSGLKGVSWYRAGGKWQASIRIDGRSKYLGHFIKLEDAAAAYDKAAKKYFGEFALTNADLQ